MHTDLETLHQSPGSGLNVMSFLNEVGMRFPDAISLESGRPADNFFRLEEWMQELETFAQYTSKQQDVTRQSAYATIAQYGRTNGIINKLIAEQIKIDENVVCDAERIIVTAGCQEGISLAIETLCTEHGDVVLTCNPTYIGITSVANINGIEVAPVNGTASVNFGEDLRATIDNLLAKGKRPKALYVIPDFDNPTGSVMPANVRRDLLRICTMHNIIILEDSPYRLFRFEGEQQAPLASIDESGCVLYLGTYSKTLCPALRTGFIAFPDTLFGSERKAHDLMQKVSTIKSIETLNSSQITQSIVGGILYRENCSLQRIIDPARAYYANNRNTMLTALSTAFHDYPEISWNHPTGGFFVTLSLPFDFGEKEAIACARDYGVIVMPMSFFSHDEQHNNKIRLAFSSQPSNLIRDGINRLAGFISSHITQRRAC